MNPELQPTDESLVLAARRGERAAFEELVRRTGRLLFARLYLETGDTHRAEDLAQETYLLAWRKLGELQDATKFRSWIATVAHRVVLDAARRDGRKKRWFARSASDANEVVDQRGDPPESIERDEERERMLSVLRSLPEEYRLPLMLRYLADADYESISRQLGLTNGSLRGLLQRGMKMLRHELERGNRHE